MANSFAVSRIQLIYALCLPLAVVVGYFLADPTETGTMLFMALVIGVLSIPLLIRWHHPMLLFAWNAAMTLAFLPGRPYLWMLLAFAGFLFAVLNRITNPERRFVMIPSINAAMLCVLLVTLGTAVIRGGGIRALGSATFGGKGYLYICASVVGYFALASNRIPPERAVFYVGAFFLSGLTALIPNLAYLGGQKSEFLFYLFPADYAIEQATADYRVDSQFTRIFGLTMASTALYCWLLMRYGLRGLFRWTRPWRFILFAVAMGCSLASGFRSTLLVAGLTVLAQFLCERLWRPRILLSLGAAFALTAAILLPNAEKLPAVVQRSISFLPVNLDPVVKQHADYTFQWRWEMWREVLPLVPQYLFMGKGYTIDPNDLNFAYQNVSRGYTRDYAMSLAAGDYHNGPLTLIIPLGIWGVLAFLFLVGAGWRYLYRNYTSGDPALKSINTFLLAFFSARVLFYFVFFGSFYYDLFAFTGVLGLSASLNGAVPVKVEAEETATEEDKEIPLREQFASE